MSQSDERAGARSLEKDAVERRPHRRGLLLLIGLATLAMMFLLSEVIFAWRLGRPADAD